MKGPERIAQHDKLPSDLPTSPWELWALFVRYPLLVVGAGLLCAFIGLLWMGSQTPVWQASATLLLRREAAPASNAVAPLHAMVQNSESSSQIALLESRGPAQETVLADALEPGPDGSDPARRLGLTTLVEDTTYQPLASFSRQLLGLEREQGRLYAAAQVLDPGAPREVLVDFPRKGRVRVGLFEDSLTGPRMRRPFEADWESGDAVEYLGLDLRLVCAGKVGKKAFIVRVQEEREAVRRVMERVSAEEVELGSGLVRVSAQDSDPHRAADTVNAVIANYLALHADNARARTRERLAQVEGELERIRKNLQASYSELVRMQRAKPLSIDSRESAKSLTLNLTGRSVDYTSAQMELALVEDAIDALKEGDAAGLAKIAGGTVDGFTRTLIEQLSTLNAQAQVQERSDGGQYRLLLQTRMLELRGASNQLTSDLEGVELALEALSGKPTPETFIGKADADPQQGRLGGIGMLAQGDDPATALLADAIVRASLRRGELLASDYLPDHPDVLQLENAIRSSTAELREVLRSRAELLRERRSGLNAILTATKGELAAHPQRERAEIQAALERFEAQLLASLGSLREALARRVEHLAAEIARFERDLGTLPDDERLQVGPLQRVENAKGRVAELLEARDTIKMMDAFVQAPAELIDPATAPARRTAPRMGFQLALVLLFGLGLGLTLAFLLDRSMGKVESEQELEESLGLMVVGSLPRLSLEGQGLHLEQVLDAFADDSDDELICAFRALRTNLDVVLAGRSKAKCVGITSPRSGEGASTSALGLALAFARASRRVLLVRCGEAEGGERSVGVRTAGLTQWLEGDAEHVRPRSSGVAFLSVLPAGGNAAEVADACAHPGAQQRLGELAAPFDLVVFDMAPIECASEALPLARLLDGLVLVVRRRYASRAVVKRALLHLDRLGVTVFGTLFNTAGRARRRSLRAGPLRGSSSRPDNERRAA